MEEQLKSAEFYFGSKPGSEEEIEGALAKVFDGYAPRAEQIELSEAFHEAYRENKPMLGEANTGVGKSLASLSVAATSIEETGRPVVIVTSSILLQEQYIEKDIPTLSKATENSYGEVLAKGKGNYVCMDKVLSKKVKDVQPQYTEELDEVLMWTTKTVTGDFSELPKELSYPVRSKVSIVNENECRGKMCPVFRKCFYYQNQQKIKSSKIIVCNYHYFFLALDRVNMLPDDIGMVIFDEFHEVVPIARDIMEVISHTSDFDEMNKKIGIEQQRFVESGASGVSEFGGLIELGEFMQSKQIMHATITQWYLENKEQYKERVVVDGEKKTEEFLGIVKDYETALENLLQNIDHWISGIANIQEDMLFNDAYEEETTQWYVMILKYRDFVEGKLEEFETITNLENEHKRLVWVDMGEKEAYSKIHSKPFDVSELIEPIFNPESKNRPDKIANSSVFGMSATLTSGGNFNHLKGQIGMTGIPLKEKIVNSPFDLTNNQLWYLPKNAPEGNQPGHNVYVLNEMEKFIDHLGGKTMCLFTSRKSMDEAADHFKRMFAGRDIEIIKQGDIPKKAIVQAMREKSNIVIVGTRSFFTGVDIQGDNLRAVLIDKLPFPMIGDPINEYLMSQELGFFKYSLPETIITIKQAFGRLIRDYNDKGVICILDGRLQTKSYRSRIFNSFTFKLKGTQDLQEALDFAKGDLDGDKH